MKVPHSLEVFVKEHWFRLSVLVLLGFIAITVFSVLVIVPQRRAEEQASAERFAVLQEKKAEEDKQSKIDSCLRSAQSNYDYNWNNSCKLLGRLSAKCQAITLGDDRFNDYMSGHPELKEKDLLEQLGAFTKAQNECSCSLPTQTAERWDESLKQDKQECYDRYK